MKFLNWILGYFSEELNQKSYFELDPYVYQTIYEYEEPNKNVIKVDFIAKRRIG